VVTNYALQMLQQPLLCRDYWFAMTQMGAHVLSRSVFELLRGALRAGSAGSASDDDTMPPLMAWDDDEPAARPVTPKTDASPPATGLPAPEMAFLQRMPAATSAAAQHRTADGKEDGVENRAYSAAELRQSPSGRRDSAGGMNSRAAPESAQVTRSARCFCGCRVSLAAAYCHSKARIPRSFCIAEDDCVGLQGDNGSAMYAAARERLNIEAATQCGEMADAAWQDADSTRAVSIAARYVPDQASLHTHIEMMYPPIPGIAHLDICASRAAQVPAKGAAIGCGRRMSAPARGLLAAHRGVPGHAGCLSRRRRCRSAADAAAARRAGVGQRALPGPQSARAAAAGAASGVGPG